jgi:hypothetical protein
MMHRAMTCGMLVVAGLVGSAAARPLQAQLSEAVRNVEEGSLRFGFEARPDVQLCANGIRIGEDRVRWHSTDGMNDEDRCERGWVEVEVRVGAGVVREVEVLRASELGRDGAVHFGAVDAADAAAYLLSLVYEGATDDAAEEAILPAMLAQTQGIWPELIEIARDRSVDDGVRKNALFWVGQEAAVAVTQELTDVVLADDEDQEIRNAAIFALSQRKDERSISTLMDIARTGEQAETRTSAMFWLAQSDDPSVVRFFEDVLLGRLR